MADEKPAAPKTKPYVLKKGYKHSVNGTEVMGPTTVQLTDAQYKAFGDKFHDPKETVGDIVNLGPTPDPTGEGSGAGAVGASHVPQDVGAQTRDPQLPNVNPDNRIPIVATPSGATIPASAPAKSAGNTSAATGSPLSPPPIAATTPNAQPSEQK